MTPSMEVHLNGFMSCFLWHSKPTFTATHLYSVFIQTGKCWRGTTGGTHIRWAQEVRGFYIQDLQPEAVGPRWSYLPGPDLGINFVLGDAGCYAWKSLVHLAAWKKHMEVEMLRSRMAKSGTMWTEFISAAKGKR